MKKLLLISVLAILAMAVFAQSPQAFKYQAVVRDASGTLLENQDVSFEISILQTSESGTVVYTETHSAATNQFGLVNLEIGNGTTADDFSSIDWGSDDYFISISLDPDNGTDFEHMGTVQLLSVPYALFADKANEIPDNSVNGTKILNNSITTVDLASTTIDGNDDSDVMIRSVADSRYLIPKSAFSVYKSSTSSETSSGWHKVDFSSARFNDGNDLNLTDDRYNVPYDGVYCFSAAVSLNNIATGSYYNLAIWVNNDIHHYLERDFLSTGNEVYLTSGSATIHLNSGDYVEIWVYTDDSTFDIVGSGNSYYTDFSGHLVYTD
jgi:hypothetical protein